MSDTIRSLADAIRTALPEGAAVATTLIGKPQPPLIGGEIHSATRMSPRRLSEFTAGRACARSALAELAIGKCAIPVGANREPVWPQGIAGSITHSSTFAAAVAAPRSVLDAIGIDIEPAEPLDAELIGRICLPAEIRRLGGNADLGHWAKALFAAKEAVYKCLWPRIALFLEFEEVEIVLDPARENFRVLGHGALVGHGCEPITGRLLSAADHFVAVATIDGISSG